jgi:hypothetical protein
MKDLVGALKRIKNQEKKLKGGDVNRDFKLDIYEVFRLPKTI